MEEVKLLSIKIAGFSSIAGGIPEMTPQQVAGALGSMPALSSDLIRWKYAGDEFARNRLYKLVANVVEHAIMFAVKPPTCGTCNGRGTALVNEVLHECEACDGTGHHYPNRREVAHSCGIRKEEWHLPSQIYDAVATALMDAEAEANRVLAKQLQK